VTDEEWANLARQLESMVDRMSGSGWPPELVGDLMYLLDMCRQVGRAAERVASSSLDSAESACYSLEVLLETVLPEAIENAARDLKAITGGIE